jgi:hypothetical protein
MWDGINYATYLLAIAQIYVGLTLLKNYKFQAPAKSDADDELIGYQIPASYIILIALGDIILLAFILISC